MSYIRSVEEIAETVRNAKDRGRPFSLLIGAGCSVKAGIPTASGFVEEIKARHSKSYNRAKEKTYPHCMAELLPAERKHLVTEYVRRAKINWAHICIAILLHEGYVSRVLTTNFDPLITRACALLGEFPAVYDFATSQLLRAPDIPDKAIFHLHGQHTGFVLLNTENETKEQSTRLGPLFDDAGRGHGWIVVGYSGKNDPVFDHLARAKRFHDGLFWIGYGDNDPEKHVRDNLLSKENGAFYTKDKDCDADSFFIRLCQELDIFPPAFISEPFTHLQNLMAPITPFPLTGVNAAPDVLEKPRQWITSAIQTIQTTESDSTSYPDDKQLKTDANGSPIKPTFASKFASETARIIAAEKLLMTGEYDKLIAQMNPQNAETLPKRLKDILFWAYVINGNNILGSALKKTGEDADRLFTLAGEKYEAALKIKPNDHEVLNNWGYALWNQTKTKTGEEAHRLLALAAEKYEAALKIKPNDHEALNNWGLALSDQAKTRSGEDADRLFALTGEKYEAALKIKPDDHNALYNWGNALSDQAETKTGEEADRLFALAAKKYEAALKIKPDKHNVLFNWGTALLKQAETKTDKEANRLFTMAGEKYEATLTIKPDDHEALYNWGLALLKQAEIKTGEETERLLALAAEKYEAALKIKPDMQAALVNWGATLSDQAKTRTGEEADRLFALAGEKYEAAFTINPNDEKTLCNWGNALLYQARTKTGEEADRLFALAGEKHETALKINPNEEKTLCNWGATLSDQAKTRTGEEADRLFALAGEKYEAALAINPNHQTALNNWGNALLLQAATKTGSQAQKLIDLAIEKYQALEAIAPGKGAYNLACAYARRGDAEECWKWLMHSQEHGTLPDYEHLCNDSDLDSVRNLPKFKEFIDSLRPSN